MVERVARFLIFLSIVSLLSSTAIVARAAALDDPPESNLPANAIAQLFALLPPLPAGPAPPPAVAPGTGKRPAALLPLYITFAALQVADVRSTLGALDTGGREGNPAFAGLRSPSAMVALKTGVAAGTTYAVERLRKRSPGTAVVLMIALNSAYAAIVAHNYAIAQH
jgi:hypothetical protein